MPFPMRCYLSILAVVAIAVIAILPLSRTNLLLVLAMCALVVVAERLSRVKVAVGGSSMSVSLVVTIITVLILTPPAAALVGLVTSLAAQRPTEWTWSKQIVTSSMSSLIPASGAAVCYLAGGHSGHFLDFPWFLWSFAAAVTTCLVVNGLLFAEYVALSGNGRFLDVLRGTQQRSAMPYYSSGVLALIFLSLWNDIGWYTAPLVVVPMYIAHWSLSQYSREEAAHEGTIAALVQAVEIKDSYTRGHSERVARGAEMLARQLRMPQERVAMLRFAGLLHDIGKLGVPTRLLTSTGGLTEEEYKLLCMHPNHGVAVLRDIRFLTEVYDGVLYHHERLDGRGYPTGKSGDAIPEFARIIGVADAFDAMTSTRSYRAARSIEDAVAELRRGAGTQFDPVLVQAFEDALALAERAGRPWLPSELPASPATADAVATETGPWPLPKRVPGFSFADHDDPFVPAEWFSNWYPNWLADAWDGEGEGPSGPYDWPYDGIYDVRPLAGPDGRIPGPRTGELVPAPRVGALEPGP
ncbi:MAG: HD-GYP domain-containing protein, partial [Catenulispora sp.]|nr:HD-GYP domain-containing protein [Catenulispora sp.]